MDILLIALLYALTQDKKTNTTIQQLLSFYNKNKEVVNLISTLLKNKSFSETPQKETPLNEQSSTQQQTNCEEKKENPQSPFSGIADEEILHTLNEYFSHKQSQ